MQLGRQGSNANTYLTEPGTKKKAIAGDGRTKVDNWTPRYMAFPRRSYTGRPTVAVTPTGA